MLETRMTELAAADAPSGYDAVFTHAVMARIAQRRARVRLVLDGALVGAGSLALAAATPFLGQVAPFLGQVSQGALSHAGLILVTTVMMTVGLAPAWWVMRRG